MLYVTKHIWTFIELSFKNKNSEIFKNVILKNSFLKVCIYILKTPLSINICQNLYT